MRRLALAFAVLLATATARAVTQPDGTPIPQGPQLPDLLRARGEPLDAMRDAAITPERFVPGCRLTFTLVTRGPALFQNSFGWYNVTGARPADSDLHVLIPCDARSGFVATLDLRREPGYRGGEIGFFLRTPQQPDGSGCAGGDCCGRPGHTGYTYFTEREFNPDNVGAGSYIHLLTYDSRMTPHAFYFAWEDLYGGGDNQFTDFVAFVGNIVCSGAGGTCDTGMMGVCATGTQQCRAGRLECVGITGPQQEACDGLDNDCDGMTDEGEGLCPAGMVCDRGSCVGRCVEGDCFEGFTCSARGTCVESACARVECPGGQRCEAGRCVEACEGVRCPAGQACRAGRCVDPCAGVTCEEDQACVAGVCEPRCECRRCPSGQSCGRDGRCVATACAAVSCPAGQACVEGACRNACEGAACPRGEVCVAGACVAAPRSDAGVDVAVIDAGEDAAGVDVAVPGSGMDAGGDGGGLRRGRSGCACRAAQGAPRAGWGAVFGLLAVALGAGRRVRGGQPRFFNSRRRSA